MKLLERFCFKGKYDLQERKVYPWLEMFSAFTAAMSFFCIGAMRSYTSPAILSIQHDTEFNLSLTRSDMSWIASTPPFVAFAGSIISAPLLQYLGRQKTLLFQAFPCAIGWLFVGFATNFSMILIGRGLSGLSSGVSASTAQLYLAMLRGPVQLQGEGLINFSGHAVSEFARNRIRGMLGFLPGMMLSLGILAGFVAGNELHWRQAALVLSIAPVISIACIVVLPESPTWLLMKQRDSEAFESLKQIRGHGRDLEVRQEINEIKSYLRGAEESYEKLRWRELIKRREVWWPTYLAVSLMFLQQFTGANAIIYFLGNVLEDAERKSRGVKVLMKSTEGAVLVGVVQFLAFFISLPLIDWLGRKISLLTSSFLMIICHISLGLYFYSCDQRSRYFAAFNAPWLPLVSLCSLIASYSIGFASVPFIIASEVFPSHLRSLLCSLCSFVNLICLCVTVKYFLVMKEYLHEGYVFFIFAMVCMVACIIVIFAMPETKGRSLAQIQELFKNREDYHNSFEHSLNKEGNFGQDVKTEA